MPRPKSQAARKGLRYERQVGKHIRLEAKRSGFGLRHNPALEAKDGSYHVPDFVIRTPDYALLLESKLRFTPAAWPQLERYAPLVSYVWNLPVIMCQVTMILTPEAKDFPQVHSLANLNSMLHEGPFVWFLPFPGVDNL